MGNTCLLRARPAKLIEDVHIVDEMPESRYDPPDELASAAPHDDKLSSERRAFATESI